VLALDLGVRGLALGHAISYVFSATVGFLLLRRRLGGIDRRSVWPSLLRTTAAAALTALAAWFTARLIDGWLGTQTIGDQLVQVVAAIAVGLAVFLLGALIFRIEEVDTVKRQLLSRRRG